MSDTENKTPSFEEAVTRLNEIISMLENGTAPLDRSLALYEEGIALVRFCNETLDRAEKRIKILTRNDAGEVVEADFAPLGTVPPTDEAAKG